MKTRYVLCLLVCCLVSCLGPSGNALARGGGTGSGTHGMPSTGGGAGTSPAAPGTNSLGTALSTAGIGNGPQHGALLGTDPAVDREEAKVEKMIKSICRGC